MTTPDRYQAKNKVRFVTAASLFDGHDAAINIMRRILQAQGAEVIHLGHNRSVKEIVDAAIQEDAQGIAVSSYQGGHIEFFKYMVDLLEGARRRAHQDLRRRRRRHRPARDRRARGLRRDQDLLPRRRPQHGSRRHDRLDDRGRRLRPRRQWTPPAPSAPPPTAGSPSPAPSPASRRASRSRPRRATNPPRSSASPAPAAPASPRSPTSWSCASSPTTPSRTIAILSVDPTKRKHRRRPARRPHPPQLPRLRPRLHALARHPPGPPRPDPEHRRVDRRLPGRGLRPDHRRDLRASARPTPRSSTSPISRSTS